MNSNNKNLYSVSRILNMREDKEAFAWFMDVIVPCLLGSKFSYHYKHTQVPSKWLSRSMEAFGLICYENYYGMFQSDECQTKPIYTADGRGKPKNQGWSKEAIKQYNRLLRSVTSDRKINQHTEKEYLHAKKKERHDFETGRLNKKMETIKEREKGWERAGDDLENVLSDEDSDTDDEKTIFNQSNHVIQL